MPCVRRFTFGGSPEDEKPNLGRAFAFQCRASGVSHSEKTIEGNFKRLQARFNAVRPAFHIRRTKTGRLQVHFVCVSMPCVRRFTFGDNRPNLGAALSAMFQCRASGVSHSEKHTVSNACDLSVTFQCRASGVSHSEDSADCREDSSKFAFQCRASGVSHSEVDAFNVAYSMGQRVSMPCVRRFTFGVA